MIYTDFSSTALQFLNKYKEPNHSMNKVPVLFLLILLIFSCREEIVEPGNFAGNINEPIQINDQNSFTFLINARQFSMNLTVPATFNSSTSRISITLNDHESGTVFISIRDSANRERYTHSLAEDVSFYTDVMDGFVPDIIKIRTESFSGKLRIQLTDVF
ncbi:MAG TPA: hypothetical protein VI362_04335 [Ignavibacteriaceae bacterium]|nr:hypothetical protein [Ignavibacteriaceae bacterium]